MIGNDTADSPRLDPTILSHIAGYLSSGASVITTRTGGAPAGVTSIPVTPLSVDPPALVICLPADSSMATAVMEAGYFAVNVLGDGQQGLAARFAPTRDKRFQGVALRPGVSGVPLLSDAIAHLECRVIDQVPTTGHVLFIGRVDEASVSDASASTSLIGGFGRFDFARDDDVYRRARELVLYRQYEPDTALDPLDLAFDLAADPAAAVYALTRLATDGLVNRDPVRGYVVVPLDGSLSDETFDARCAIEIGAIDTSLGTVSDSQLNRLRLSFAAMSDQLVDDRFVDFGKYLDANFQFHEQVVMLAGNAALRSAFHQLSIKAVMTRSFGSTRASSQQFIDAQRAMLLGIEARDVEATRAATIAYRDLAKARVRVILSQTGGRL